jgi:hypothetical protein
LDQNISLSSSLSLSKIEELFPFPSLYSHALLLSFSSSTLS